MENTIENAKKWVSENQSKYPNIILSDRWAAQILFDYVQQLKILNIPLVNVPLPDDIQAFNAVTRLRKELKDKGKDENLADVNGWLMGVNWCKDFIKGNAR